MNSAASWLETLDEGADSPLYVAVVRQREGELELVATGRRWSEALGLDPSRTEARPLRALLGEAAVEGGLGTSLRDSIASPGANLRHRLNLPGKPSTVFDSTFLPPPVPDGQASVLWLATDVTRITRLEECFADLALSAAAMQETEGERGFAATLAQRLLYAAEAEAVEVWDLTADGKPDARRVRKSRGPAQGNRTAPVGPALRPLLDAGRALVCESGQAIAVPIHSGGRAVGAVRIELPHEHAAWREPELRWLERIASLVLGHAGSQSRHGEDRLRWQRQTRAQLARMARGIAHDFNNLLVGIQGGLELAYRETEEGSDLRADLDLVQLSTARAVKLCQSMLALDHGRHGRREAVLLGSVVRKAAAASAVDVQLALDDELPVLRADPDQLERMVACLVENAAQAMEKSPRGEPVRITSERVPGEELARAQPEDWLAWPAPSDHDFQALEVVDTGEGIPAEHLERVVEPFFTTRGSGNTRAVGLGLSMVLGIVESLGGGLRIQSAVGNGTRVRVLIPSSEPENEVQAGETAGLRVLVIDDDRSVLDTLARLLHSHGVKVETSNAPLAAAELVRAADPPFDAIIVDAQMPDCDGPETIARVRVVAPDLPAILTSGCSPDEEPASPFAFLQKPFTAADLVAVLGRAVATRS